MAKYHREVDQIGVGKLKKFCMYYYIIIIYVDFLWVYGSGGPDYRSSRVSSGRVVSQVSTARVVSRVFMDRMVSSFGDRQFGD